MKHTLIALFFATLVAVPGTAFAQFVCEIETHPSQAVKDTFETFHTCTQGATVGWLEKYPEEVDQLAKLYQAWKRNRTNDLRGTAAAAKWAKQYPIKFDSRDVTLTAAQVETLLPLKASDPVSVAGEFERLFVDRDNKRLFLTTAEEGLVSISIAKRYDFKLEGKVGAKGGKDFFVLDAKTAILEQPNPKGGNRDLVILDISDRNNPREVSRLKGAIPEVSHSNHFSPSMTEAPPTFDQYKAIREGKMQTSCGPAPYIPQVPTTFCRPDGTCYKTETRQDAEKGICTAFVQSQEMPMVRRRMGRGEELDGMVRSSAERPEPVRSMNDERSAPQKSSGDTFGSGADSNVDRIPQGGKGGAGSLSQMMVHRNTLYVLSTAQGVSNGWLTSFDISQPRSPRIEQVIALNNGPEALQLHDTLLLIAGRDAVMTASLAVAKKPRLLGEFRQDCPVNYDPIVVQGSVGYRTIIVQGRRINCTSRLEVIDLSRPHQPMLRNTYPIGMPRGLAVMGDHLFVADQNTGIKIFDISDDVNPKEIWTLPMGGVKDLVLSDFDLYAMSGNEIRTFFVGPLYLKNAAKDAAQRIEGPVTVKKR